MNGAGSLGAAGAGARAGVEAGDDLRDATGSRDGRGAGENDSRPDFGAGVRKVGGWSGGNGDPGWVGSGGPSTTTTLPGHSHLELRR